jgi:hypothetical protein
MDKFMVVTVDHDEQEAFVDPVAARNRNTALETALEHRMNCCYGAAFTAKELRDYADDLETHPPDIVEEES